MRVTTPSSRVIWKQVRRTCTEAQQRRMTADERGTEREANTARQRQRL
jgi:hypothetical protein